MQDNEFIPDNVRVQKHSHTKDVRLTFERAGVRSLEVVLPQGLLAPLAIELQSKVESGSVRPMNPGELKLGVPCAVMATNTRPREEGGFYLDVYVQVPDGCRIIPIDVPPGQAGAIIAQLMPYLNA